MFIDHIFIFSNQHGEESDELIKFGLTEGSNRTHQGQGTTNRKFYFENFFLEILWVTSEQEIRSPITSITKLWERSQFLDNGYSRFGLCLANTTEIDSLFEESEIYQPSYLPDGMGINIITNQDSPYLPWTFRLPYRTKKKVMEEPIRHTNGIKSLTKVEFIIPTNFQKAGFVNSFDYQDFITFRSGEKLSLILEFDNRLQNKEEEFRELNLTFRY